jgi:glutathione S-transferase
MLLMAFAEKNAPVEFVHVEMRRGEQKRPEHLARQPFGVLPVLDDDGYEIYEARAILRYLDRRLPEPSLSPDEPRAFGRMEQLIGIEQSYFSPNVMQLYYAKAGFGRLDAAGLAACREALDKPLDVAEKFLEGQTFLAGDRLSLADIAWAPYLGILRDIGHDELIRARPRVSALSDALAARPSWKGLRRG